MASLPPPEGIKHLRLRYREAARSFLNTDTPSALQAIDDALQALPPSASLPAWVDQLDSTLSEPLFALAEQKRKAVILFATLIATCCATPARELPDEARADALLAPYLPLKPEILAARLFQATSRLYSADAPATSDELPLPSPSVSLLPPSVIVALALGALKVNAPRAAKAICEAWLGSVDERIETALETEGEIMDAAGSPSTSLTSSALSLSVSSTPTASGTSVRRDTLLSYERILELYALHILPQLGAWDEAEEWVKLLAKENGGYARASKVEWLTLALRESQRNQGLAMEQQRLRAEAQVEHERERRKASSSAAKKAPSGKRSSRRKGQPNGTTRNGSSDEQSSSTSNSPPKAQPSSLNPSPGSSPTEESKAPTLRRQAPLTGFAAMRAALADYLHLAPLQPNGSTARPREGPLQALLRALSEQTRALAFLAFIVALVAWRRRARRRMSDQLRELGSRVAETFRMATRATYL